MKITLRDLLNNGLIWNKEQVRIVATNGNSILSSKVDRFEFMYDEYDEYELHFFESGTNEANGESIIIFHVEKVSD